MRRLGIVSVVIAGGVSLFAAAAAAQPATEFTQTGSTLYNMCQNAKSSTTNTPIQSLAVCDTVAVSFVDLRGLVPDAPPDEADYFIFMHANTHLSIAALRVAANNVVLNASACEATERSWLIFGEISENSSYAAQMAPIVESVAVEVRGCRNHFAPPDWARAL